MQLSQVIARPRMGYLVIKLLEVTPWMHWFTKLDLGGILSFPVFVFSS